MLEKRFNHLETPLISQYEDYLPTAFSGELTLLQKINKIIKDLERSFQLTNEMVDYLNQFIKTFDEKLYDTVSDVLKVWLDDGILADVVRESINEEVVEARKDVENEEHGKLNKRLEKWEKRVVRTEDDIKTQHLNVDWYAPRETTDYTSVFDELIVIVNNTKTPIYLPEFKTYYVKKNYPSLLFYGNGKIFNSVLDKEIQISSTPDNVYQYSSGEMKHKNLFGTFNNANVQSLVGNDSTWLSGILGIYPDKPETLSTYPNRDNATQFLGISTHNNFLEFKANQVTYLEDGVYIPSLNKEMDIPIGSILDTRHSPYYSGLVKSVDYTNKIINLYKGWYKTDGSKQLVTPPNNQGLTVNRATALWCANWLVHLDENHENVQATMFEAGMVNNQPHVENVNGIDMVNMGVYGGKCAFQARSTNDSNIWLKGFYDDGSNVSFEAKDSNIGFYAYDIKSYVIASSMNPVVLRVLGDANTKTIDSYIDGVPFTLYASGVQNKIGLEHSVVSINGEIDVNKAIHIIKTGVNLIVLPDNVNNYGLMVELLALDVGVGVQGRLNVDGNNVSGHTMTKGKSVRFYCDGYTWFKMGD